MLTMNYNEALSFVAHYSEIFIVVVRRISNDRQKDKPNKLVRPRQSNYQRSSRFHPRNQDQYITVLIATAMSFAGQSPVIT
jgi:hypothetical protein